MKWELEHHHILAHKNTTHTLNIQKKHFRISLYSDCHMFVSWNVFWSELFVNLKVFLLLTWIVKDFCYFLNVKYYFHGWETNNQKNNQVKCLEKLFWAVFEIMCGVLWPKDNIFVVKTNHLPCSITWCQVLPFDTLQIQVTHTK